MVKELIVEENFDYPLDLISKEIILNTKFEENHHKLLGNTGIQQILNVDENFLFNIFL